MAKYLVSTTETYRVDTENEAARVIEEAKKDPSYVLEKYMNKHKKRKITGTGGDIDEYWELSLTKLFNDIKEPNAIVNIEYEVE